MPKKNEFWIPVSEKLPDSEYDILMTNGYCVYIGFYEKGVFQDSLWAYYSITHWAHIPELPKKEKTNEKK